MWLLVLGLIALLLTPYVVGVVCMIWPAKDAGPWITKQD
jgi:predicted DNA repair protein MutK